MKQTTQEICDRAKAYIKNMIKRRQLNNMMIAEAIGVGCRHIQRAFKATGELQPRQYIIKLRAEEAHKAIQKGTVTFKSVAEDLGFADSAHMSRTVKRFFGCSPKEVRKKSLAARVDSPNVVGVVA